MKRLKCYTISFNINDFVSFIDKHDLFNIFQINCLKLFNLKESFKLIFITNTDGSIQVCSDAKDKGDRRKSYRKSWSFESYWRVSERGNNIWTSEDILKFSSKNNISEVDI